MRKARRTLILLSAGVFLCAFAAVAQAVAQDDSPSLGDVARQTRLQKQKDTQAQTSPNQNSQNSASGNPASQNQNGENAATMSASRANQDSTASSSSAAKNPAPKAKRVITNEELPEAIHPVTGSATAGAGEHAVASQAKADDEKLPAEQWKSQIQAMKSNIASLQKAIDDLSASIQFAPGNCVSGCVEWNERQRQKQEQVETMKSQLAEQQKNLEDMQESARRQGYGSSVYDP